MARDPENTLIMDLKTGPVVIALRPDLAPNHVARIKELTRKGFYDGVIFHRVIPDFMAHNGRSYGYRFRRLGSAGPEGRILRRQHKRGTVSAARTNNPNSANSQFFICFTDAPWLDRQIFDLGEVVEGMDHIDAIKRVASTTMAAISGAPDKIVKLHVEADS